MIINHTYKKTYDHQIITAQTVFYTLIIMDPEPYENSDMTHPHLSQEISGILKQKYLVPYQNNTDLAIGILFGPHARPIISLPVEPLGKKGEALSVHFFVDTAAPTTFLAEAALKALFKVLDLSVIESTNVSIWGTKLAVNRSVGEWQGINILGTNFLRKGNFIFECSYDEDPSNEFCMLKKKPRND